MLGRRGIRWGRRLRTVALCALLILGSPAGVPEARACWTMVLQECFNRSATQWPWVNPPGGGARWINCAMMNGQMVCWPNLPQNSPLRWGIQSQMFDQRICGSDQQGAWVIGQPTTEDPRFDGYPPNIDTYMIYGPLNLTNAVAARVLFFYFNRSEPSHDSLYWGAATDFNLTAQNMQISDRHWGRMNGVEFNETEMDLANLRNYTTGDSVSMVGQPTVYVFWRFKADGNANPAPPTGDVGAFVDEVIISYDNGGIDLRAESLRLMRPDSSDFPADPQLGDTVWASLDWSSCDGGVLEYPSFRITGTLTTAADTRVVLDTVLSDVQPDTRMRLYTGQWINDIPGDYVVRIVVDTLNEVTETSETNNAAAASYHINAPNPPPVFTWVTPGSDTLWADSVALLRWVCTDPGETAQLSIYYDQDRAGCVGVVLPGGTNRDELDGPDSLVWNVRSLPIGRMLYFYADVRDAQNEVCVYSPDPMVIARDGAAGERRAAVREFALRQAYPNPFNPATTIEYQLAVTGAVRLRVFDLTGREVRTLVDGPQSAGLHRVEFDGRGLASGVYICTLSTGGVTTSTKVVLLR
jgi:hypothetical protein